MEQVSRGAEAAVGAGEVETVMEANPGLGVGLEELALIHIWGDKVGHSQELLSPLSLNFLPPHHFHPPFTMAHATSLHLEAGVAAAVPGTRAALGTAGLAAEGGIAQCHPVCRG